MIRARFNFPGSLVDVQTSFDQIAKAVASQSVVPFSTLMRIFPLSPTVQAIEAIKARGEFIPTGDILINRADVANEAEFVVPRNDTLWITYGTSVGFTFVDNGVKSRALSLMSGLGLRFCVDNVFPSVRKLQAIRNIEFLDGKEVSFSCSDAVKTSEGSEDVHAVTFILIADLRSMNEF